MRNLIIGLGNIMLSDDGVGVKALDVIKREAGKIELNDTAPCGFDFVESPVGGLSLLEIIKGYSKVFIIDSIVTGSSIPGTIYRFSSLEGLFTRNTVSTHDTDLPTALDVGKTLGISLPSDIRVWAIEAKDTLTFREGLTPEVENSMHIVVNEVIGELFIKN